MVGGERLDVDARPREPRQDLLAVPAVGRQHGPDLPVIGKRQERRLGHRVHGEGAGERLEIQGVGRLGVLRPSARPEQALRAPAQVVGALPPGRGQERTARRVDPARHRDPEPVLERVRHLAGDRRVPPADEDGGDRPDAGVEPGRDAPLDAAEVGVCGGEVVLTREEKRHVHGDPGEGRLLDGGESLLRPGDLDEQVPSARARVERLGRGERASRVIGQQR